MPLISRTFIRLPLHASVIPLHASVIHITQSSVHNFLFCSVVCYSLGFMFIVFPFSSVSIHSDATCVTKWDSGQRSEYMIHFRWADLSLGKEPKLFSAIPHAGKIIHMILDATPVLPKDSLLHQEKVRQIAHQPLPCWCFPSLWKKWRWAMHYMRVLGRKRNSFVNRSIKHTHSHPHTCIAHENFSLLASEVQAEAVSQLLTRQC